MQVMQMHMDTSQHVDACSTLVALLRWRAQHQPERRAYTFLVDGETHEQHLTYGALERQARAIAVQLQALVPPGERALLLYPAGLEYIAAFFGCLYAGVVAVPAYPPQPNRAWSRLQAIVADAQTAVALTTTTLLGHIERQPAAALAGLRWVTTDALDEGLATAWREPSLRPTTLAFLQYTSGSTGQPRGVMLSHGNLLHNARVIQRAFQHTAHSVGVGWLPLYHDMGLIGNVLQPLYAGFPCVLMSPLAFLQRPSRWLQAISRFRATTSGGPNFAYELCAQKMPLAQRATLDLSSWEVAFNGAEPIRAETLERFSAAFAPCGLRRAAFYPCYGLAEATLMVTGGVKTAPPVVCTVQGAALARHRVQTTAAAQGDTRTLVGCGQPWHGQRVVIVDPDSLRRCPPGQVGEIWVAGGSVAQGYWHRPEETMQTFRAFLADTGEGPFLRTGDLGFVHDHELFITGRRKDVIIIDGCNHYPQDIERTVEQSHPAVRPGGCAACAVDGAAGEQLLIVAELEHHSLGEGAAVLAAIRQHVAHHHDIPVSAVLLLKPGGLPKTSSGKVQRYACRTGFLAGTLEVVCSG